MTVSLIITTYNWSQALGLVLHSVMKQSHLPDEVIVADDGSTEATRQLIEDYQRQFPVSLIHAWQPDEGFRAARSRNNAVYQSSGDYLIFIDGDTILHRHFIADHIRFAKPNHFAIGSRVLLTQKTTEYSFQHNQFDYSIIKTSADNAANGLHLPVLAQLYAKPVREPIDKWIFKVRSCNMAIWRCDYETVNGFNHDFQGWGREDSEFALRLFKKGLLMRRLKFVAIQYHLFHDENDRSQLSANDDLLTLAKTSESYRCVNGLSEL